MNRMASQVSRLSDPMDFQRILQVASDLIGTSLERNGTVTDSETDALTDILKSTTILIQGWPVALKQACADPNDPMCSTVRNGWEEIARLMVTLSAQLSDWRLNEAWNFLLYSAFITPDSVVSAISEVSKAIASALSLNETCQYSWSKRLISKNVSMLIQHMNFSSECLEKKNVTVIVSDSEDQIIEAIFTLNKHFIQSLPLKSGFLTVTKIPAPQPETVWIGGGLPVTAFTERTLLGNMDREKSSHKAQDPSLSMVQSHASSLRISSPIYLVETSVSFSANSDQPTEVIKFMIHFSDPNTYYDIGFYELTGRGLWKAEEAKKIHLKGLGSALPLTYPVRCVFWNSTAQTGSSWNGSWDSSGCFVTKTNLTHAECSCTHLSAFALAKEPNNQKIRRPYWVIWGIPDPQRNDFVIGILMLTTNGLSLISSLVFFSTMIACIIRTPIRDVYLIHCLLCASLMLLHTCLLIQPFVAHQKTSCIVTSIFIQAASMFSTGWLFCEAVALFRCFVLGDFGVKRTWIWIFGIVVPGGLVILTVGLSKLSCYGEDLLCLPAHESYVFWMQFGTIFCYLFVALLVCIIIGCNIETPAYIKPIVIDKLL